jgi:hypothetical protein
VVRIPGVARMPKIPVGRVFTRHIWASSSGK